MNINRSCRILRFFSAYFVLITWVVFAANAEPIENKNSTSSIVQTDKPDQSVASPAIESVSDAFKNGRTYLNLRYRYEGVDQDGLSKNANASTLRTRLGFETAKYKDIKGTLEIEDVQAVGNDLYNDTSNGKTNYPVVADPDGTEINQAFLAYEGITDTTLKGGRRILNLDDERFVGEVAWRQNSQTFDGVEVTNNTIKDTTLFYNWNYQVNRVLGEDSEKGVYNSQAHFFNIKNKSVAGIDLTAFSYLLDFENAAPSSSATYGMRANGKTAITDKLDWLYDASYAYQNDYAENPASYSANYYHVASGVGQKSLQTLVGYEVLGSDDGISSFQTPLATLHKFNGWADLFLTTPGNGLTDLYVKFASNLEDLSTAFTNINFEVVFHDFRAEQGSEHYGTEWDYMLSKPIGTDSSVALHYADYQAIDNASDTSKVWISLATKFSS